MRLQNVVRDCSRTFLVHALAFRYARLETIRILQNADWVPCTHLESLSTVIKLTVQVNSRKLQRGTEGHSPHFHLQWSHQEDLLSWTPRKPKP